jgi:hypothetical protein
LSETGLRDSYSDYFVKEETKVVDDQKVLVTTNPEIKTTSSKDGSVRSVEFEDHSIKVSQGLGDKLTTRIIPGSESLMEAVRNAAQRALADGLSAEEAKQFNNLRAYVTNHCADGKFDANEVGAAIQRANNIAPAKGR